jgi:hypothetical protein
MPQAAPVRDLAGLAQRIHPQVRSNAVPMRLPGQPHRAASAEDIAWSPSIGDRLATD